METPSVRVRSDFLWFQDAEMKRSYAAMVDVFLKISLALDETFVETAKAICYAQV